MKYEILSWQKSHHECGIRLNLIGHEPVFCFDEGVTFNPTTAKIQGSDVDLVPDLTLTIEQYDSEKDYSVTPAKIVGEDKSHVVKCIISGSKTNIKKMMNSLYWSTLEKDVNHKLIEKELLYDLKHEIYMLRSEIEDLNEKLKDAKG